MSLGVEDLHTICFALNIDWRLLSDMTDEAGKIEKLVRQLEDQGRIDEVQRFLSDFRFPQGYPPLPRPPADNIWLTYLYACQNVRKLDQLQSLVEQIGTSDATQRSEGWQAGEGGQKSRLDRGIGRSGRVP